ncbi:MAG: gamma-glutamyltransferase [Betaproteobacteria bacterium]|nr:gamma-glutamyltransferase [Betaproteobacteria bacterium]MDE2132738.1 gamma-glutamyltransferase [Betaproteobacteria bacterium]MDE2212357.1 gamma-glutamyltransferase [Betaproteobacteria bacterium]
MEVLKAGGNAVDAAAAIQFALNVVEPQSSGIGGGAFLLIHSAQSGENLALDARETAPAAATADQFAAHSYAENSVSGLAVGVPGTLAGFAQAQRRWGRLTLARVLQPAIRLARDGFAVTPYLARSLQSPRAALQPETRALFRNAAGEPLREGDWLKQPELAHTFELIAREGPDVFYRGEIARAIVAAQQRSAMGPAGVGRMTLADLSGYRPEWRKPLVGHYRGATLVSMPPPSSGGVALLQVLGMLERFPLGHAPGFGARDPEAVHVTIEALRLAMADRARWLGDPAATAAPLDHLLSPAYLGSLSRLINPRQRLPDAGHASGQEGLHTTHFSVVDAQGNVVSCTSTVEDAWGSGILVPGYGFLLNNELTDFNRVPRAGAQDPGANDVRPGLRPRSSMAPTLVFRGDRWWLAYGSPGGVTIISSVLETTQALLDDALPADAAVRLPRYAVLDAEGHTLVERELPRPLLEALTARGHLLKEADGPIGSVQVVGEDPVTHERWGAADPRRDGTVLRF